MYTKENFSKCLFNPLMPELFEHYKQLEVIQKISNQLTGKVMSYLICVYDYNSPFVRDYRSLVLRKQEAARFCGYDLVSDAAFLKQLFELSEPAFLKAVDVFLKEFVRSRLWALISGQESLFWEFNVRVLQPIGEKGKDGKDAAEKEIIAAMAAKTALSNSQIDLISQIETGYQTLYGDEVKKFTNRSTSPELIAQERANLKKTA